MRKLRFLPLFFFLFAGTVLAQEGATPPDSGTVVEVPVVMGPLISFEEPKKDFGQIKQGQVIEHTFVFQNTGNLPLLISEVKTTCGCTATRWPSEPIAPGEKAAITARFDSSGKKGAQQKVISVISNSLSGKAYLSLITHIQPRTGSH